MPRCSLLSSALPAARMWVLTFCTALPRCALLRFTNQLAPRWCILGWFAFQVHSWWQGAMAALAHLSP